MQGLLETLEVGEEVARHADEQSYLAMAKFVREAGEALADPTQDERHLIEALKVQVKASVDALVKALVKLNDGQWHLFAYLIGFRALANQGFTTLKEAAQAGDLRRAMDWAFEQVAKGHIVDPEGFESDVKEAQQLGLHSPLNEMQSLADKIGYIEGRLISFLERKHGDLQTLSSVAAQHGNETAVRLLPHYSHLLSRLNHEKTAIEKLGALSA